MEQDSDMQNIVNKIKRIFDEECHLRVMCHKESKCAECIIITVRVHYLDMQKNKIWDLDILNKVKEEIPNCIGVVHNDSDASGNQYIIIITI